jgi:glyoxylase-like metal-dependent hydrolase (beta-lactamase superfamily II)
VSYKGIHTIDTLYVRPGLDASHLIIQDGHAAFVDTGPASGVPQLLAALDRLDVDPAHVDYVLLTHVHLDHAGGAGLLLQSLPNARAVIHPRGARHMVDPAKLIAGSLEVYGEEKFYELYGDVVPIPEERVLVADDGLKVSLPGREFELIHTPGHALHHYSVIDRFAQVIFPGDNFGISLRDFDTRQGEFVYPTTTPVHFDPDAMHATIHRLMGYKPQAMYLTHFGRVEELERLAADLHECVNDFVALARKHDDTPDRGALIRQGMFDYLSGRLEKHGFEGDAARRHELLDIDIELNSQGLEVWLDRGPPKSR